MTATQSRSGRVGSAVLAAAIATWAVVVVFQKTGEPSTTLTFGVSAVSLLLFAVGTVALVKMMVDIYSEDEY